ncbi:MULTISPECIES: hypothetical protein [Kitasatospora]|uniref:hypothetical protein n=1 Tax=Kitasatospora TaxID=2063 RepID=UPI000C70A815|nr:hypothetical protein [Kitasatospora sp. GP30]MDH6144105.1 hypothetical protein [Kitasatospora sp. GP30]
MRVKHALALAVSGAVLATVGAAGVASASTGTASTTVTPNAVTLYEYQNLTGPSVAVPGSDGTIVNTSTLRYSDGSPVSTIGSLYNDEPITVQLFFGPYFQGPSVAVPPYAFTNLQNFPNCAGGCTLYFN